MKPTFQTGDDYNLKVRKVFLGCMNSFEASIVLGERQALLRIATLQALDFELPTAPEGSTWKLQILQNGKVIDTMTLAGHFDVMVLGTENTEYSVRLATVNAKTSKATVPPVSELIKAYGQQPPIAVIFEIC